MPFQFNDGLVLRVEKQGRSYLWKIEEASAVMEIVDIAEAAE